MLAVVKGLSMEKRLCQSAMGVSGLSCLIFLLDAIIGFPFDRMSVTVDVISILACLVLGYLAWNAYRDVR